MYTLLSEIKINASDYQFIQNGYFFLLQSAKSPTEKLYIASGLHVNQPLSITQIVWYWEIGLGRAASVAVLMQATKNVYLMF